MNSKLSFLDFLNFFPKIELPMTLGSDTHHVFDQENKPLPEVAIEKYLTPIVPRKDEFTEYIACFRLPSTDQYHAIVFWQAALMEYKYVLVTYDLKGTFIDKRIIAGTTSNGKTLLKRVATIDEDGIVFVAEGEGDLGQHQYSAEDGRTFHFEILQTGDILLMINEN
ncbi:MAG: hypothetical protein OEQ53_20135 [Saprospiraceae bacterium]|nr:hypothetical protein [Saprospiraceae bacterium]